MKEKTIDTKSFTLTAMFTAIIFLLTFTPFGYIPLGVINATIVHVPVIIGSIILGPKKGGFLGAVFGFTSILKNTLMPVALSFAFSPFIPVPGTAHGSPWALVICFIPRILVGVVPYYVYIFLQKLAKERKGFQYISLSAAGVAGAITNTLLVMHLIYFIFKDAYASVRGISASLVYNAVLAVIGVNGVPEAIVAGVITAAVGKILLMLYPSA